MENKANLNKENEINSIGVPEDKMLLKIFCPLCFQFPEYSIKFISSSNFRLVHECLEGKMIESSFDFEKDSEPYTFTCSYCNKTCNHICVKCKYIMCQKCSKKHIRNPYALSKKTKKLENANKSIICIMNNQYICENHLLQYKFYCPVCKINLCQKCKEEHFHINCPYLSDQKFKSKEISEPSNDCFKLLFKLSKLFYDCYGKNLSNSRMTLNILLNTSLADNIINFIQIQDNLNNEGKEIKNNFLNDINEDLFLLQGNESSKFEQYFCNLLIQSNCGNICACKILNGIIEKYEKEYKISLYNKYILRQSYLSSLNFKNESFINKINFAAIKIDLNETNIILANCLKMINDLKLKNEFFEFCLQLMKIISLKMNYKLDYELRRKIGNLISTIMLKNFSENLEPIPKSKKMLLYSSEYLKKKMNETTPTKNNKSPNLNEQGFESIKSKYKLTLKMLNDEIVDELDKIEKGNSQIFANNNINIIRFKNLSEETEEINKAVICNLFFTIKWKLGDELNHQIHNVTHSINSLLLEQINALENNQNENINAKEAKKNENENIQITAEKENNQFEDKNKLQNIICPKKYGFLGLLNSMQFEEKKAEVFDEILETDDEDPILDSSIDDFIKVIKDIKITYCTSSNISIEDSLDLYLNGKKGNILKREKLDKKVDNMIDKINKISQEDNPKIAQISKLADKIKKQFENNLSSLSRLMDKLLENLEKLWKFFDIKELFEKYEIEQPLNPLEEIESLDSDEEDEIKVEEIHFLVLVLSFFFIKPKINEIQRLKNDFEKIGISEIIKQNLIKKTIIKKLTQNIRDFNMSSLISKVWDKLRDCDDNVEFVEDKKMNTLIKNYLKNKTEEDFKLDLIDLIKPYCTKLDLDSYDPQNITLEPFMIQNHLLD